MLLLFQYDNIIFAFFFFFFSIDWIVIIPFWTNKNIPPPPLLLYMCTHESLTGSWKIRPVLFHAAALNKIQSSVIVLSSSQWLFVYFIGDPTFAPATIAIGGSGAKGARTPSPLANEYLPYYNCVYASTP